MEVSQSSAFEKLISRMKLLLYVALVLSVGSAVFVGILAYQFNRYLNPPSPNEITYDVSSDLIIPTSLLRDAPTILALQPFGSRLTGINSPFNSSELAVINNASDTFFSTAASMFVNRSLANYVAAVISAGPLLKVNGKPAVTYLGAISCIYCGENRWAMALALSRFGGFQQLFKGYSSLGDGDVPTLYWAPAHYNSSSDVEFGNFYVSKYVTFLSVEYASLITAGFQMAPLSFFQQRIQSLNNPAYQLAIRTIINSNAYTGTPFTIWGKYIVSGADAIDFGDSPPTSTPYPLTMMTHEEVLGQLAYPHTQFAWTEYAAADLYVALLCRSFNAPSPTCSMPAIISLEKLIVP